MKKTVKAIMAVLIAVTLCFSASAFTPQKIKSLHPAFSAQLFEAGLDGEAVDAAGLVRLSAHPRSELEIVLSGDIDADLFYDQNGEPINTADVTISKMRAANVAVSADIRTGGEFIKSVELNVKNAGGPFSRPVLRVGFVSGYTGVHPSDFDAELVITIGGERQEQSGVRIAGIFGNSETVVMAGDESVYSAGTVLVAGEYIPSIEVDAGGGVFAEVSMDEGGRYLLSAVTGGDDADMELMRENAHIVDVITLSFDGFDRRQIRNIRIDDGQALYVCDESGKAVGMTGDKLPFSEKYYLTDKAIEF